jgi:RluA family pseudouridine synthase
MIIINSGHIQIPALTLGKGWLVVDKPSGLTVHNSDGRDLCSLVLTRIQQDVMLLKQIDMDSDFGVNPVHRLDKETSGVMLLAANRESFRFFSSQFESRQVKKQYVAILHGRLEKQEENDQWGTWGWPLSETAGGRQNPEGPGNRKDSRTRYRVLGNSAHYTMVAIELLTGRTHQIRRHAKLSGHPIVGDARYGSTRAINYLKRNFAFDRLALHARSLTLQLTGGKAPETIETPEIPRQMQDLFDNDFTVKQIVRTKRRECVTS